MHNMRWGHGVHSKLAEHRAVSHCINGSARDEHPTAVQQSCSTWLSKGVHDSKISPQVTEVHVVTGGCDCLACARALGAAAASRFCCQTDRSPHFLLHSIACAAVAQWALQEALPKDLSNGECAPLLQAAALQQLAREPFRCFSICCRGLSLQAITS